MSEMLMIQRLLDQKYQTGEPWKLPKGTGFVLPILGEPPFPDRNYVLLQEVKDKVEFKDSGGIHGVETINKSNENVYVRKGTMLKGQGTQSRSPVFGVVLEPITKPIELSVNCIHASHGINARSYFVAGGVVPHAVEKSLGNQSDTWNSIACSTATYRHGSGFPRIATQEMGEAVISMSGLTNDNLVGWSDVMNSMKDTVDDVLKDIPGDYLNQLGIAVFDLDGVVGVEVFNHPESWKAYSESITRSYSDVLTKISDLYEVKTDRANDVLMEFLEQSSESEKRLVTSNSISKTWALSTNGISGELIEIEGKEIHIALARDEKTQKTEDPRQNRDDLRPRSYLVGISDSSSFDISNWSTRRGAYTLLDNLSEKPQRFTELLNNMEVSRGTLSSRLREATDMDLINRAIRKENGGPVYALTEKGKETKTRIGFHVVNS